MASQPASKLPEASRESEPESVGDAMDSGLPDAGVTNASAMPSLETVRTMQGKPLVASPMGWRFGLLAACAIFTGMAVVTTLFVLIRDSMSVSSSVDGSTAIDATMVCADGTVNYPSFSIMDRILGNGSFVCTDWQTKKRYTILPK